MDCFKNKKETLLSGESIIVFILANYFWLFFLLAIPFFILVFFKAKPATMLYSDTRLVDQFFLKTRDHWPLVFRCLAWFFLCIAMSRPQHVTYNRKSITKGIDIVFVLDTSSSMASFDFDPQNRLEAAKEVFSDFVKKRPYDRIGTVVFASMAYTQCPLTLDHNILLKLMKEVKLGKIKDGTAIGLSVATAIKRLKQSRAKTKIIILLSDGENNMGGISPKTSAELAKSFGLKIYSIGIGRKGKVRYPVVDAFGRKRYVFLESSFNEKGLKDLSSITGGLYFRAENKKELQKIYKKIDRLEKTKIHIREYRQYHEYFSYFLWIAVLFLFMELFWKYLFRFSYPE